MLSATLVARRRSHHASASKTILSQCFRREAIRSIVISQRLLGTREIAVVHHSGCGMLTFTTEQLQEIVRNASPGNSEVADAVNKIEFLEISNLEESVEADVKFLQEHPLVLEDTKVTGWVYEVESGKVNQLISQIRCHIHVAFVLS